MFVVFFSILELILNRWLIIEDLPVASFTRLYYQSHGERCGNVLLQDHVEMSVVVKERSSFYCGREMINK